MVSNDTRCLLDTKRTISKKQVDWMKKSTIGSVQIGLASMCFGLLPLLTSLGYRGGANAITILAIRFTVASVLLWGYIWLTKKKFTVTVKQLVVFAIAAILGYGIMAWCYFTSFKYIPSSMSAMILFTYPVIVTYLSSVFLKARITPATILALVLVTVGGVMMTWGQVSFNLLGIFFAVATTVLYSSYIVFLGSPLTFGQDPQVLTAFIVLFAAIFCTGLGAATGELTFDLTPSAWGAIIFMAVMVTVVAMMLFYAGVQKIGPSLASILGNIEPITAFLLGLVILGEKASVNQWLGSGLILVGVLYVQLVPRMQARKVVPAPQV